MIDKEQFLRKYNGKRWDDFVAVGPVINRLAEQEGETRQPWEILRDELPDLLDFGGYPGNRFVEVPLGEVYVVDFCPTRRHRRPQRIHLRGYHGYHGAHETVKEWIKETLGEEPVIRVPYMELTAKEAPIGFIVDWNDPRFTDVKSVVYRWYDNSLWTAISNPDIENELTSRVDRGPLSSVISSVLKTIGEYIVVDGKVWTRTSEPVIHVDSDIDWGTPYRRWGAPADANEPEYKEGYTNPIHWVNLTNEREFRRNAGSDDWFRYFSITQIDEALQFTEELHASFNAICAEEGKDPVEAVCPFSVTVYLPESLSFEKGPREGEAVVPHVKCPKCGDKMDELTVSFTAEATRAMHHGVISDNGTSYYTRDELAPFKDSGPLFTMLQCSKCNHRSMFDFLENHVPRMDPEPGAGFELVDHGVVTMLELVIQYMDTVNMDDFAEDLRGIVQDWQDAAD